MLFVLGGNFFLVFYFFLFWVGDLFVFAQGVYIVFFVVPHIPVGANNLYGFYQPGNVDGVHVPAFFFFGFH
ncbi:hypothetical protein, partial [Salmonella enterica]|uniref:hypothetical protein n=1 Tax=Salmonella enterica TaxID=28901 RepID=UPI0020C55CFB